MWRQCSTIVLNVAGSHEGININDKHNEKYNEKYNGENVTLTVQGGVELNTMWCNYLDICATMTNNGKSQNTGELVI